MRIIEHRFRASQVCRVLGSPIAFGMATLLLERGPLSLTELARPTRRSKPATCYYLNRMRLAHLIRYESRDGETVYWIKYPAEVRALLVDLAAFVHRAVARLHEEV